MNPFDGKSPTELCDGVPGLSNAELDALAACVCDGEWVRPWSNRAAGHFWQRCYAFPDGPSIWLSILDFTTDWGEAGRLLEKYPAYDLSKNRDNYFANMGWGRETDPVGVREHWTGLTLSNISLCRAITEAAVIAELMKRIENVTARLK